MKQSSKALENSYNNIANEYDKQTKTFHHEISSFVTMQNLKNELPKSKRIKILDSGGGTGNFAIMLSELGYDVELSDISEKSIDIAFKKAEKKNLNIKFTKCNSERTPFEEKSFDFIMMNGGVINYTPNPNQLLKEKYRLLKKNGILWFDFLNTIGWSIETQDPGFKIELANTDEKIIQMPDWDYPVRLFSLAKIRNMLKENEFKLKSEYGLVLVSNSLPLEMRYSNIYDHELVEKYKKVELEVSRQKECIGASWSCCIAAVKQ